MSTLPEEMSRRARALVRTGRHNPQFDSYSPEQHKAAREFDEILPQAIQYLLSEALARSQREGST